MLARGEGGAAGIADRHRILGLDAGGDRHRLVQERHPGLLLPARDLRPARVAERGSLEGGVPDPTRQLDRLLRLVLGLLGHRGPLRTLDVEPYPGRTVAASLEQARSAAEPAVRDRGVAGDPVLGGEVDRDVGGGIGIATPLVLREGLRPQLDRRLLLAEPPERLPEPVERLGAGLRVERALEGRARALPVATGEGRPRLAESPRHLRAGAHEGSSFHHRTGGQVA
jgi:hypothetical protein